jgi:NADPH:quinone reductase-like Zn-dependent oxidoreductase
LIWGVSSSFGALAAQLAGQAGYAVVGVAHGRNADMVTSLGVTHFVDRTSDRVVPDLIDLGPFKTVLAAADSAEDQVKIGQVLAAQGGGEFLSTMGVRSGVELPKGVTGRFHQFVDDYLDPKNEKFTQWFWWDYLENALANKELKSVPLDVYGGLSRVGAAWDALRGHQLSGRRLIIQPDVEEDEE